MDQKLRLIKMKSSDEESCIFYLSDDEIKSRIIEEMQNYSFIYEKSDPLHSDRDKKIQVYETIGAFTCLDCKYFNDTTRKTHVKYHILGINYEFHNISILFILVYYYVHKQGRLLRQSGKIWSISSEHY